MLRDRRAPETPWAAAGSPIRPGAAHSVGCPGRSGQRYSASSHPPSCRGGPLQTGGPAGRVTPSRHTDLTRHHTTKILCKFNGISMKFSCCQVWQGLSYLRRDSTVSEARQPSALPRTVVLHQGRPCGLLPHEATKKGEAQAEIRAPISLYLSTVSPACGLSPWLWALPRLLRQARQKLSEGGHGPVQPARPGVWGGQGALDFPLEAP